MQDDFNEFSNHPWHILSLCALNLLIIHDFLEIVIILCFTNWIRLSPNRMEEKENLNPYGV